MEITAEKQKQVEKIVKNRGLKFAVVFGSRANGKARENSDLDIGILDEKEETYRRFGCLFSDFSKIFQGYNVDLRMIKGSEPVFLYNVLVRCKFLGGDEIAFHNLRFFAYKNFIDSKPLFDLKMKILEKQQKLLKQKIKYA